jgi:hypothetical protein
VVLPGPIPAGTYAGDTYFAGTSITLVWQPDGGAGVTLLSTAASASHLFDAGLPAVPAHCGDLLVVQLSVLDGGPDLEPSLTLAIP